jgi:GT2 family glycosyltransferase
MTSVSICITNYQSGDTIALCIESIRKFTSYPHEITVYDDATNPALYDDLTYLREIRDRGWIRLIEGNANLGHGPALATLIDSCPSDLAMILDCDIQITDFGWLDEMVATQGKVNAAMVVDLESFPDNPLSIVSPFFMLDMRQYPHVKVSGEDWHYTRRPDFISMDKTPNALYPTGYHVLKNCLDQGRPVVPIPASVHRKFFHHTHISVLSVPMSGPAYAIRQKRYAVIQAELRRLRASG